MGLTSRQQYILKQIAKDGYKDMAELTESLGVSDRTIRRDLDDIRGYLINFNVSLKVDSGRILLSGSEKDIENSLANLGKLPQLWVLNAREREIYIALELLRSDGPLKMAYFSHKFNVVEGSISIYLDRLERWFKQRSLKLIRRRGYGVEVAGSERDKREALVELLYDFVPAGNMIYMIESGVYGGYGDILKSWFENEDVKRVKVILREKLKEMDPPLDEASFYGFLLHVILSVDRSKRGESISIDRKDELMDSREYRIVKRILKRLLPEDLIKEDEAAYLTLHLKGAKLQLTEDSRLLPLGITTMELAYSMARGVGDAIGIPIENDRNLISGLAQHLEPAIYRVSIGLAIRNPLLTQIKERYQKLYNIVNGVTEGIFRPYGYVMPEEEIGYITMHMGAAIERWNYERGRLRVRIVCPNGIGSAELLAGRIRKELPELKIMGVSPMGGIKEADYDILISTIPLNTTRRHVVVSPFLTAEDIENIRDYISDFKINNIDMSGDDDDIMTPADDEVNIRADEILRNITLESVNPGDLEEMVEIIAETARDAGICTDTGEVKEIILEREKLGSVVLPGKMFALIHGRSEAVFKSYVGIFKLVRPLNMRSIGFNMEKVSTVLVMLAPIKERPEVIALLGKISSALIESDDLLNALKMGDIKEIREAILNVFNKRQE
ncbi:MAG: BglG family transcription antiterminator [Thermoanaerobacteraceae bacterium]|nr:BglG family transcription antiterminator [Thermoanaerobacteraceae bacterium]